MEGYRIFNLTMRPLKVTEVLLITVCGVAYFCIYNLQSFHRYSMLLHKEPIPNPINPRFTDWHVPHNDSGDNKSTVKTQPPTTSTETFTTDSTESSISYESSEETQTPEVTETQTTEHTSESSSGSEWPVLIVSKSPPKNLRNFFNYSASIPVSNYFKRNPDGSSAITGNLLISQEHCKIPEISLWSTESNASYGKAEPLQCLDGVKGSIPGLSYVNKTQLVINTHLLASMNLSFENIQCCYQFIQQIPQKPETYEEIYFHHKILSDFCIPMSSPSVLPLSNQIKVTCYQTFENASRTEIHHDYHILANPQPQTTMLQGHNLVRKIKHWKNKKDIPVSILIYGFDCGNRLNVRRQMPLTAKYFEDSGAFEMVGYVKVGPHTSSNIVPALSSFHIEELEVSCDYNRGQYIDKCPWIFKNLSDINYVTSFIEDGNSFTSGIDRFLNPPTDFYHIPWMRYVHRQAFNDDYNICMENKTKYQVMIDHMQNLAEIMDTNRLPFFHFSWYTDISHDNFNGLQAIDEYLRDSIQYLKTSGHLDNTIIIIMGDHGYRWYPIRHSISGWYEDKQPVMWMMVPPKFAQKHPEIHEALKYNRNKLACPFDLHQTFRHVISLTSGQPLNKVPRGQSLFQKLEDRNCSQAGIPIGYCPCAVISPFKNADRPFLKNAAVAVLNDPTFPQSSLPDSDENCTKVTIKSIIAAAVLGGTDEFDLDDDALEESIVSGTHFVLGISTNPPKKVEIEFIIKYEENAKPQFQVLYYFGVDSTNIKPIAERGYYHCE